MNILVIILKISRSVNNVGTVNMPPPMIVPKLTLLPSVVTAGKNTCQPVIPVRFSLNKKIYTMAAVENISLIEARARI